MTELQALKVDRRRFCPLSRVQTTQNSLRPGRSPSRGLRDAAVSQNIPREINEICDGTAEGLRSSDTTNLGEKRERTASVSYLEIEQAAIGLLLAGDKPSIATVRKAVGDRGSSQTIHGALKRFWRDLGLKAQGDPAALSRLPIEIAESVESIWQRALALAATSAKASENEAQIYLERLKIANEVREQSLIAREKELEVQGRERERVSRRNAGPFALLPSFAFETSGRIARQGAARCHASSPGRGLPRATGKRPGGSRPAEPRRETSGDEATSPHGDLESQTEPPARQMGASEAASSPPPPLKRYAQIPRSFEIS